MPLDEIAQEYQSFITPDGVFTSNRVQNGQTNATFYFQSTVTELCLSLREWMLQWLDEILIHCTNEDELFCKLRKVSFICRENWRKLHARKCQFYTTTVNWRGRVISEEYIRRDPKRRESLLRIPTPNKDDELQQFLCAVKWMSMSISQDNELVSPLSNLLEEVLYLAGSRTKEAAAKVMLSETLRNRSHTQCFEAVKRALATSLSLGHPDPAKSLWGYSK